MFTDEQNTTVPRGLHVAEGTNCLRRS